MLWAEDTNGNVLAIHDNTVEPFPFSCVLTGPLPTGDVGAEVTIPPSRRQQHDITSTISPVSRVMPSEVIDALGPQRSVQPILFAERLVVAITAPDPQLTSVLSTIVGRGVGLTPAGDDVILGAIAAESAFAGSWRLAPRITAATALIELEGMTTRPSLALLRAALAGHYPAALCDLFAALQQCRHVGKAIARVRRIGHTSGESMLCGVAAVAEHARKMSLTRKRQHLHESQ